MTFLEAVDRAGRIWGTSITGISPATFADRYWVKTNDGKHHTLDASGHCLCAEWDPAEHRHCREAEEKLS